MQQTSDESLLRALLILSVYHLSSFVVKGGGVVNEIEYCICVPFWKCKEDNNGLKETREITQTDIRKLITLMSNSPNSCQNSFDVCCKLRCGHGGGGVWDGNGESPRVTGQGNEAQFAEFPWMLAVMHGEIYRCGASLIHPQVALTAAHCIEGTDQGFRVRGGEWNWEHTDEHLPHQDRRVKKIIVHPFYHSRSLQNDIALLIVDEAFHLMENVGIVCLPRRGPFIDGTECVAAGWGKSSFKSRFYQSTLKKIDLPIMPRSACERALREATLLGPYFVLHSSFVCAGGRLHKDTCPGDGGSPLVCRVNGNGKQFEQIGIVSWGLSCGARNSPGVYVNVARFREWIDRQMTFHNFDKSIYEH